MAANVQQSMRNYTVKSVETVLEAADVKARIFTLAPGDVIPWHYHSDPKTDEHSPLAIAIKYPRRIPIWCQTAVQQIVSSCFSKAWADTADTIGTVLKANVAFVQVSSRRNPMSTSRLLCSLAVGKLTS